MALILFILFLAASMQVSISKHHDVVVTKVSANSTILQWKTAQNSMIDLLKIDCNGTRRYTSTDGQQLLDTDEKILAAPPGKDHILIEDLQPNFNYSCTLWEYFSIENLFFHREASEPVQLTTDYGAPEKPRTPEIQEQQRKHSIKILLFSTSTKFGPISGYQVQFHLVERKTTDNLPLIDDEHFEPFWPFSPLISKNEAQTSTKAKSFWIDFKNGMLPNNILIDESLLNGTLKGGTEYIVVTVPYTLYKKDNESIVLFTHSKPSAIFKTYSGHSDYLNTNDTAQTKLVIALIVVLSTLVLGFIIGLGIFVYCVIRRRRKKLKKKYSRRDVVAALAMRHADQHGIEIAFYGPGRNVNNNGDLPWLDPFSALERRRSGTRIIQDLEEGSYIELPAVSERVEEELQDSGSSGEVAGELQEVSIEIVLEEQIVSESETTGESHELEKITEDVDQDLEEQPSQEEMIRDPHKCLALSEEVALSSRRTSLAELSYTHELESKSSEVLVQMQQNQIMSHHVVEAGTTEEYITITESDSEEIWVTPNTSPSNSVTMLHTQQMQAPEYNVKNINMLSIGDGLGQNEFKRALSDLATSDSGSKCAKSNQVLNGDVLHDKVHLEVGADTQNCKNECQSPTMSTINCCDHFQPGDSEHHQLESAVHMTQSGFQLGVLKNNDNEVRINMESGVDVGMVTDTLCEVQIITETEIN